MSSSPSSSSNTSSPPSVRFDRDCTIIPELGTIRPRLATRKYSLPLTLRAKPSPSLINDPTFTPSPPGPCFSFTLPSLSRAPPRSTNSLERRRSIGHTPIPSTSGNGIGEKERYLAEYGLRSCLVHGNGNGSKRDRRYSSGSENEKGCGPQVICELGQPEHSPSTSTVTTTAPITTSPQSNIPACPSSPPASTSSRGIRSLTRRLSNSLTNGNRHPTIHPGCITEEPEMENAVDDEIDIEEYEVSPLWEKVNTRIQPVTTPTTTTTRSRSSSFSSSTSNTNTTTTGKPNGKLDQVKIPLRGCCSTCERASELGGQDETEWEIEFDKRAKEKRERDEKDKEKLDVFALGNEIDGDVGVGKLDVVVDEVDCVRKGKCADGIWITTRPGTSSLLAPTPTSSSTFRVSPTNGLSTPPSLGRRNEDPSSYFDHIPNSGTSMKATPDSPAATPLESIPEIKSKEEIPAVVPIAPSSTTINHSTTRSTGPIEPLPPQLKRANSNSVHQRKKSGGWLGFSVTKALGVM